MWNRALGDENSGMRYSCCSKLSCVMIWFMLVPDSFLFCKAHISISTFGFESWVSIAPDRFFWVLVLVYHRLFLRKGNI